MITTCPCGSGEPRRDLIDARGIFCQFACDACEEEKSKEFRPEIFTDGLTYRLRRRTNAAIRGATMVLRADYQPPSSPKPSAAGL
jgi:hypothetical protein